MEFGFLENVEGLDLNLPPDHPLTSANLGHFSKTDIPKVYLGTSKFGRKEWIGSFYPVQTKDKDFLGQYVQRFNSIELNATHHRFPPSHWISKWKETASEGFRFCPKMYKAISHRYRLKNCERLSQDFYLRVMEFGENLGPVFLQFPENFTIKSLPDLLRFLDEKPGEIDLNVEFRHQDWFSDSAAATEVYAAFFENRVGTVITDTPGRRDVLHMRLTSPVAMIRFVGAGLHSSDFERLDQWVDRLSEWFEKGLSAVYFFMHQHDALATPKALDYLVEKLNDKMNLHLKSPLSQ